MVCRKPYLMKRMFFWINLIFPAYIIGMLILSKPDFFIVFDSISPANRCLGKSDLLSSHDSNETATKLHHICKSLHPHNNDPNEYIIYVGRMTVCWVHVGIAYFNFWNILEFFIYCAIFGFMRRYKNYSLLNHSISLRIYNGNMFSLINI